MSRIPNYTHNVSRRMSQVMDEIGVNENIVMKRRKTLLQRESLTTLIEQLECKNTNYYFFGSQSEGTTTLGLRSDLDCLFTINNVNVIQDWHEWEHGKKNLLMIQDETVSPGYCLLQELRNDAPLSAVAETNVHSFRDERGRILLKNTSSIASDNIGGVRHGPANSQQWGNGVIDTDLVLAYTCQSFPVQARSWLDHHRGGYLPSNGIIQYCNNKGCFVVGVGSKGSENELLEWRISTSMAERCLMFNLNITQIRCYVLMKMILKTFITPRYVDSISSFMCKTVLFHCISYTRADEWKESTLLTCLPFCLTTLYNCVLHEYCPHFFITANNLMIRRFPQETKRFILETFYYIIESNGRALLEIECDNFGIYLHNTLNDFISRNIQVVSKYMAGMLLKQKAFDKVNCLNLILFEINDLSYRNAVRKISYILLKLVYLQHVHIDSKYLIAQQLCFTIGSILASANIFRGNSISYKALSLMSLGLNTDVASGKLKLASVFYCIGDFERTELILRNIENSYDLSVVEPVCQCYIFKPSLTRERFNSSCYESKQENTLLKHITASCVRFVRCEVKCCPHEFQHEMFRSTHEDFAYRGICDEWMDMAVVDSLPYLYFLQYKIYHHLGRFAKKEKAIFNLVRAIATEPNLGHRETALNLLGQCMENENRKDNALKCYMLSLKVRERNNAAKFLICRLLSNMIYRR